MSSTNHDVNLILKARDEATAKLNRLSGTIKGLAVGVAGYFSARVIGGFLKSSVAAFAESETAARGLSDALQSIGESGNLAALDAYAKQMQKLTTYEDDAVIASMKLGVTIGGLSGRDLEAATTAAIGLSKAFGIDLDAAMKLVSKAATGNFGAFSKLGITFKDGMTPAEKYAEVLDRGASGFRIAQGETETFSGILAQLKNAWGDAKESVGQYIAENARLKGVFQAVIFGLQNIGDVAKTAWATAKAAMLEYYDAQAEKANKPGLLRSLQRSTSAAYGTIMGMGWAYLTSPEYRNYLRENQEKSRLNVYKDMFKDWNFYRKEIPLSGGKEASEAAGGLVTNLMKKWDEYAAGKFGFNAAAAVAGAGMGRTVLDKEKSVLEKKGGWSLFESRTAGGVHIESPESRKLDRMIDLLARIAERGNRVEQKEAYVRTGNPTLLMTNFR